jgi:putative two-component system response regulator
MRLEKRAENRRIRVAPRLQQALMMSSHLEPDQSAMDRSVLVVDDENGVRSLMSRWLEAGGYAVASAADADEALGVMESFPTAVALCDIRMPGHDGLWLADRIRQQYPETAVIIATGVHDASAELASARHGVVDYLTKPFGRDRLRDAVTRGIEWHRSARDSRCWRERLEQEVAARQAHLGTAIGTLRVECEESLDRMLAVLSMGEPERIGHTRRVAAIAVSVAQELGLSEDDTTAIRRAALLHELGKLAMPDAVMRKPAPLSGEEQAIVRRHPAIAFDLLARFAFLEPAAAIVRDTHERPDGLGYPGGLKLADISIGARIVSAADAYDTMIRPRVYRNAITAAEALMELDRCGGTQFDSQVVRVLKSLLAVH